MTQRPVLENVSAVYPLTSMQEGMLYHTIIDPRSGVFLNQISIRVEGSFEADRFKEAWNVLIRRHDALRAAFVWDGLDTPVQVIRQHVDLPWSIHCLTHLDGQGQQAYIEEFLADDRGRVIDISRAPVMRMTLFDLGNETWEWVWTHHHMVIDGWSVQLLLEELVGLYEAESHDAQSSPQPEFEQRSYLEWLERQSKITDAAFWRNRLGGFSEPFRVDVPGLSDVGDSSLFRAIDCSLGKELTSSVLEAARVGRVTPNTYFAAAWGLVLSRWSRSEEVVFGLTGHGRPPELAGVEKGVGMFINTLPLRLEAKPRLSATEWLRHVQTRQLELTTHQAAPLATLQGFSDIPEGREMFETILVYQNVPAAGDPFSDASIRFTRRVHHEQSNYPLALLVFPGTDIELRLVFDSTRLSEPAVRSLVEQLRVVLRRLAQVPEARIGEVELLGPEDRAHLEMISAGPPIESDDQTTIHDLIGEHFGGRPESVALSQGSETFTYGELDRSSSRLASRISDLFPRGGELVGINIERSPEMIVAIVGILRAGCAYVPLDPSYPHEHLRALIESEDISTVVTGDSKGAALPDSTMRLPVGGERMLSESPKVTSDDLAYVIHTSGSSGRPKGVMVSHHNLVNSTVARHSVYPGLPARFLLLSSFAFDSSMVGIFWTLCSGGTIVIPGEGLERDVDALVELVRAEKVTHLLALPALYDLILDAAGPGDLDSVQVAIVAGETCSAELARKHHRRIGGKSVLYNEYGPTEATVWATAHRVAPEDDPVPIGRPIPGSLIRVVDQHGNSAPLGFPGELWIGGRGVSQGYRGLPEQSDRSFVTIAGERGPERYYRTGDLVAQRSDGSLLFLGRADRQVKVRGHRIEVGGVESTLSSLEGVSDAVVVARPATGRAGHRLIGYVVGDPADGETIRSVMRSFVPAHMVPDAIEVIDRIPRLPNGKVDYRNLERLTLERSLDESDLEDPRTPTESNLAEIWRGLLDRERVGIHQSFFDLGGDSIAAIRMVSRARQRGIPLEPADVAAFPTIAAISAAVEGRKADEREFECLVPIHTEGSRTPLICLHAAGGNVMPFRVLADQLGPDQPVYAFTARGIDGRATPLDSIGEMAHIYIEELRRALPNGPYRLLGDCLGGCIAHEMTAQLEASGESVDQLIVIDGALPWADSRAITKLDKARRAIRDDGLIGLARGVGRAVRRRTETALGASLGGEDAKVRANRQRVIDASLVAFARFEPGKVDAPLLLIRAAEDRRDTDGMYWHTNWEGHAGEMETVFVDADHSSILHEPAVQQVAETLSR